MNQEILKYLPQRPPFVLVDNLLGFTSDSASSAFKIDASHLLVEDNLLTDSGLIENMAQTTALIPGANAQKEGKEAPVGFIAVVKDVTIEKYPEVGEEIFTVSKIISRVMQMEIAEAVITNQNKETLAKAELRIFLQE